MSTAVTDESIALYSDCARQAVTELLNAICGVSLQPQRNDGDIGSRDVTIGVVSLVGDAELTVFIGLPRATAPGLVARFAGMEVPYDSADMGDAVGEVANMLAGGMKRILGARNIKVNISLPTVMRAENLQVLVQHGARSAKMGFQTELGTLWVGVAAGKGGGFVA